MVVLTFLDQFRTRLGSVSTVLVVPRITTTWSGGGGGGGARATTGGGAGADTMGAVTRGRGLGSSCGGLMGVRVRPYSSATARPGVFSMVWSLELRSTS